MTVYAEHIALVPAASPRDVRTAVVLPESELPVDQRRFGTISIDYSRKSSITVADLKRRVIHLSGVNVRPEDTKIVFAGAVLQDNRTLDDYNYYGKGDVLHFLVVRQVND